MYDLETANKIIAEQEDRIRFLERQIERLNKYVELLEIGENGERFLPHNARGAGRKKDDEKTMAKRERFRSLQNEGVDMEAIMGELGISRATYYRLKKYWDMHTLRNGCADDDRQRSI